MPAGNTRQVDDAYEVIKSWLTGRVAFYVDRPIEDLDPDTTVLDLGLDSVHGLTLCGDVEERFGLVVEPTLVWDYPTISAIATFLNKELRDGR